MSTRALQFAAISAALLLAIGLADGGQTASASNSPAATSPAQAPSDGKPVVQKSVEQSPAGQQSPAEQKSPEAKSGEQNAAPDADKKAGEKAAEKPAEKKSPSEFTGTPKQRAWKMLRDGLNDPSADRRAKAVNALGLLPHSPTAERAALKALDDEKDVVRTAAATALGEMHAVTARKRLEQALDDREPAVVLAAANSLTLIKDGSAYDVYYGVLTGSMRTGDGLIKDQLKILHDKKKMAEMGFEEGIGFIPYVGIGYSVVKTVTKNDGGAMRAIAARKLAHDPDPRSEKALVNATQDKAWLVRVAALDALAQRGDKTVLPDVKLAMDDEKEDVRYIAAACVIHLSDLPAKRHGSGAGGTTTVSASTGASGMN